MDESTAFEPIVSYQASQVGFGCSKDVTCLKIGGEFVENEARERTAAMLFELAVFLGFGRYLRGDWNSFSLHWIWTPKIDLISQVLNPV